jgi:hypothetical protein
VAARLRAAFFVWVDFCGIGCMMTGNANLRENEMDHNNWLRGSALEYLCWIFKEVETDAKQCGDGSITVMSVFGQAACKLDTTDHTDLMWALEEIVNGKRTIDATTIDAHGSTAWRLASAYEAVHSAQDGEGLPDVLEGIKERALLIWEDEELAMEFTHALWNEIFQMYCPYRHKGES